MTDPHCHDGRRFPDAPVVLEMLRALGVELCPRCRRAVRVHVRRGVVER